MSIKQPVLEQRSPLPQLMHIDNFIREVFQHVTPSMQTRNYRRHDFWGTAKVIQKGTPCCIIFVRPRSVFLFTAVESRALLLLLFEQQLILRIATAIMNLVRVSGDFSIDDS